MRICSSDEVSPSLWWCCAEQAAHPSPVLSSFSSSSADLVIEPSIEPSALWHVGKSSFDGAVDTGAARVPTARSNLHCPMCPRPGALTGAVRAGHSSTHHSLLQAPPTTFRQCTFGHINRITVQGGCSCIETGDGKQCARTWGLSGDGDRAYQ